jgi:fido (protein-threonine AMPylation protein)
MALPHGCPGWEYKHSANYPSALIQAHAEVLGKIQTLEYTVEKDATDLRALHRVLFISLVPPGYDYYAGNYRGHHKRCLRSYDVEVNGDARVGAPAASVAKFVYHFSASLSAVIRNLETDLSHIGSKLDPAHRAVATVRIACAAFVDYLTIHPFADGNGHASRALLWITLARFGYYPTHWTIDPRPVFSPYSYAELIVRYRDGDTQPLEDFVLSGLSAAADKQL